MQHIHWANICFILAQQVEYHVLVWLGSRKGEYTKIQQKFLAYSNNLFGVRIITS